MASRDNLELYGSLMKWLRTFPTTRKEAADVTDGVDMAKVLNLLAPDYFDATWLSKVSPVSDNKRLKANNVRKVVGSTLDYLKDMAGVQLHQFPVPDVNQVVLGNKDHIGRLLQLILGVAINCSKQAEYIQQIMEMEEEVQRLIMLAIQELHGLPTQSIHSMPVIEDDAQVKKLMENMEETRLEKETLAQRCHELELRLNLLQEEKCNLSAEFEHLQAQMGSRATGGPVDSGIRYKELKKENETLKQELENLETGREELQGKLEDVAAQLAETEDKVIDLQRLADQSRALKDEVDILRETSEKVAKYEATIETYKKRLEEMGDLKGQIKYLEEKNTEYIQKNLDLEDELGNLNKKRPQVEVYKKQVVELNAKLSSEAERADRIAFDNAKIMEKLEALSVERDRLVIERDALRESNEELKLLQEVGQRSAEYSGELGEEPDSGMLENIPPSVKERLVRLHRENKQLKAKLQGAGGEVDAAVLQSMVEDMREREEELNRKYRESNKRVLELEARLEESLQPPPRIAGSREELELKLTEANKKIDSLQEHLNKKDLEMVGMEERYKKYIEKAKSVIKTLDPKQTPNGVPEVNLLRTQLAEKDRVIDELEKESEKSKAHRDKEERLMASAFYDLGMKLNRGAVEGRLANLSQGQSFLARQRQSNTRRQNYANGQESYDY